MPEQPIRVIAFKPADRSVYYCQWTDPATGRKRTKTTGTPILRKAERFRGKLEDELNAGAEIVTRRTTWKDFRARVERDFLPEKRPLSRGSYLTALNAVDEHLSPLLVSAIDADAIDRLKASLRANDVRDTTIASYLRMLKAVLRWGHKRRLVPAVPSFDMPPNVKVAGGRPITDAEFAEVLKAVPDVVGRKRADGWSYLIRGLWVSGLRIGEASLLTWDDPQLPLVAIDRARPMLLIPGGHQKGGRDTITPIVPEFLALLNETPPENRTGFVFNPVSYNRPGRPKLDTMKRIVSAIGEAAGVTVNAERGRSVTAHDLRRSFCHRWSRRVMPQVLRVLARHADVATTLTYYADADADMTFDAVYEAVGALAANVSANTPPAAPANGGTGNATSNLPETPYAAA